MPECPLVCPRCGLYWANLKYKYGGAINAKDVFVVAGKRGSLKNGEPMACSDCSYEYSNHDVFLAIASEPTKLRPGQHLVKQEPDLDEKGDPIKDKGVVS